MRKLEVKRTKPASRSTNGHFYANCARLGIDVVGLEPYLSDRGELARTENPHSRLASHEIQISCSKHGSSRLDHFRMFSLVSKVSGVVLGPF